MVSGFQSSDDFGAVLGWELYQVTLDKFHVMFFFEGGQQLLNVAHSFSHLSADGTINYTYELYGSRKAIEVDRLLRRKVVSVNVLSRDRLSLVFDNEDQLIIHDHPEMQSWWFIPVQGHLSTVGDASLWELSDED